MTQWKDIKNFEGYYQVSSDGQVRSLDRHVTTKHGAIKHLKGGNVKLSIERNKYITVRLTKDAKSFCFYVHRLVAETFLNIDESRPFVNHKNFNRSDNRVENLEWVNRSENAQHAIFKQQYIRSQSEYVDFDSLPIIDGEEWKEIDNTRGLYSVSNLGRFRSEGFILDKTGTTVLKKRKRYLLTCKLHPSGYLMVPVKYWIDNKKCPAEISHRIVAKAFIPNPLNKLIVNHKNGIKTDNRVENLEWVTYSENQQHVYDCLNRKLGSGTDNGNAKLTDEQILDIKKLYATGTHTHKSLALLYNVNKDTIYRHLRVNHKHNN